MVKIKHFEADTQQNLDDTIQHFVNSTVGLENLMDIRFFENSHRARVIYKEDPFTSQTQDLLTPPNRIVKSTMGSIRDDVDPHEKGGIEVDTNLTNEDAALIATKKRGRPRRSVK